MYFNFSIFNPFHHSTILSYLLQAFHYATFHSLQYYTSVVPITTLHIFPLHNCIVYSYRSTITYYTTNLYNSLLFQLSNPPLYKPLVFTIYSYRSITLQSLIVFDTCIAVNTRLFYKNLHVFQLLKYPTISPKLECNILSIFSNFHTNTIIPQFPPILLQ